MDTKESDDRLIVFEDVTLRIRDRRILPSTVWQIKKQQNWAVLGPNGSGKSTLLRAINGQTPVIGGRIRRYGPQAQQHAIGFISFEGHQRIIAEEQALDEARCFSGKHDSTLSAGQLIEAGSKRWAGGMPMAQILSAFDVENLLSRPLRHLSTGEMRKILIVRAVMQAQSLLVLDEPFAGLDQKSRGQLRAFIDALVRMGIQIILATHRHENILPALSHIICLKEGRVFAQGTRDHLLRPEVMKDVFGPDASASPADHGTFRPMAPAVRRGSVVIELKHATVRYGPVSVFEDLSWKVRKGENWAITGPNGSGKTTLLRLIAADHPQAYANEIYLFGKRRGSGESIWEIKQRIGLLSSEFQINYRKAIRCFDVVLSGFFHSIGLYRRAGDEQRNIARTWFRRLKLSHLMDRRYDLLSYGEKRMILLVRAVVTTPEILILDEPCQGLDPTHRRLILQWVDDICGKMGTQLLYVSHYLNDLPACVTHIFDIETKQACRKPEHPAGVESVRPLTRCARSPLARVTLLPGSRGSRVNGRTG